MPRSGRIVIPGYPHHVTQRGNRKQIVFFSDTGRVEYLNDLNFYARKNEAEVLAYCLMSNHVHLLIVPSTKACLSNVMRGVNLRHALRINKQFNWTGHLWQDRFFSSPLDETALAIVARYVETNPVRAKMVERADDYYWSSAAAHCGTREDPVVSSSGRWGCELMNFGNWAGWLNDGVSEADLAKIRMCTNRNQRMGSDAFLKAVAAD